MKAYIQLHDNTARDDTPATDPAFTPEQRAVLDAAVALSLCFTDENLSVLLDRADALRAATPKDV